MCLLMQAIWGDIWKGTLEKNRSNATNVTMHLLKQVIWGVIWKLTLEKNPSNAPNAFIHVPIPVISGDIQKDIPEKSTKQMQTTRLLVKFIWCRSKFGNNSGPNWVNKLEAALALINYGDVPPYQITLYLAQISLDSFKTMRNIPKLMFSFFRLCYFPQTRL